MAFIDEYSFTAKAGKGGDGAVHWHREKFKPKGGPDGGDGGRGGDVIIQAVRDITALRRISRKKHFEAFNGAPGEGNSKHGKDGKDIVIELPIGSVVTNTETGTKIELIKDGEKIVYLHGGDGGFGNEHFKSSTNQTPMHATKGREGEKTSIHVELKLIADVGLVGLPNAGKTSLLNTITNAGAKVGEYPFTTLDPNLGIYHGYIFADIPGLIEGASEGKGLGHKFLRHITRTNVILHCISLERDTIIEDYKTISGELAKYSDELKNKKEYIVLTKSDTVSKEAVDNAIVQVKRDIKKDVIAVVSIIDDVSIKNFMDALIDLLRNTE